MMSVKSFLASLIVVHGSLIGYESDSKAKNLESTTCSPEVIDSWCPIEVDLSVGFDDFRGISDGSWDGNFGSFASVSITADLPYSFFVHLAGSYGVYDWNGRGSTPYKDSNSVQQQGFITTAFSWLTPCDFGMHAGFAYDSMLNNNFGVFAVNPYIDQIRAQLGYLFLKRHEIGAWATYGIDTAKETALEVALKFRGVSQVNLFYCNYFPKGGYAMLWGGTPYRQGLMFESGRPGAYILGARLSAPLSQGFTLFGHAVFMGGRSNSFTSESQNNASNVSLGLTYSFGKRRVQQTSYMCLADNSNFLVDTNQNF